MAVIAATPSSALAKMNAASTESWQRDLKTLFDLAKERFPDVVWELTSENEHVAPEEVWGHKAIVYARAPPSFLAQYFDVRPNGASRVFSPLQGENPTQSTFSLSLPDGRYSPSDDFHAPSPTPSGTLGMLRLSTDVHPALFSNQLEYLYTGAGIGDAFEFLFDSQEDEVANDVEAHRIDKLRKDMVFMWRSRLYSDVRIELTGPFSPTGEKATAVFSSHRFILASRTQYFRSLFLSPSFAPVAPAPAQTAITITLPSPPFTPASLHFTLGYIYSGTLYFSNRTFDLDTAFAIYRSALYISLPTLQAEIQARIVEEMMHGLYHAYLTIDEYNSVTGGRWGVGGCHCKICVRRAPRILEFALIEDVRNPVLERGARRALVGIFGEGWVTPEFGALPVKARTHALRGVHARTTVQNVFTLLFAAQAALSKLGTPGSSDQPWTASIRDLVLAARSKIDEVLCAELEEAFQQEEWLGILERDGAGFNDADQVSWIMSAIQRGLNDNRAPTIYQVLVNSVLLRSQTNATTGVPTPVLSSTSPIRKQTEQARLDIIRWLRKRWLNARMANAFEPLEDWALKEISDELELPVDDLLAPAPATNAASKRNTAIRADAPSTLRAVKDSDSLTPSLRASVLNRNATRPRESLASSRTSIASIRTTAQQSLPAIVTKSSRPSAAESLGTVPKKIHSSSNNGAESSSKRTPPAGRPKSLASSVSSVRSAVSVRSTASNSTLRKSHLSPPSAVSTESPTSPTAGRSPLSESSTSFQTAPSTTSTSSSRRRTASSVSTTSLSSSVGPHGAIPGLTVPIMERQRRISAASQASAKSAVSATRARAGAKSPAANRPSVTKPVTTLADGRAVSIASTRGTTKAKGGPIPAVPKVPSIPSMKEKGKAPASAPAPARAEPAKPSTAFADVPGASAPVSVEPSKPSTPSTNSGHASQPSDGSIATVRMVPILNRKASTDTITKSVAASASTSTPRASRLFTPRTSVADDDVPPVTVDKERPTSPLKKVALAITDTNVTGSISSPSSKQSKASLKSSKQSKRSSPPQSLSIPGVPPNTRGVTLQVGIPCMISSKRSRFKAFARYIGEVDGEEGPWVGVEVPVSEGWSAERLGGRDWNDGSIRGVRYFEIGSNTPNSLASSLVLEETEERAARRRRVDAVLSASLNSVNGVSPVDSGNNSIRGGADNMSFFSFASSNRKKREGDLLLVEQERLKRLRSASPAVSDTSSVESRGLFVRPTQVLLVMGAPEQ